MSFSYLTKYKARIRQWGRCARCGESLDGMEESAHHLLSESCGGMDKDENCVILCQNCHSIVHNTGNFQSFYIAPLSHFPYAKIYGGQRQAQARASRTR